MINNKELSVLLNLSPKYLHKDIIYKYINEQLEKLVLNNCFMDVGKIIKIKNIISVSNGKIHIDTGYLKTQIKFNADVFSPVLNEIIKGKIEKYDTNGGIYVNYNDIISIFCLNTNINKILNKSNKNNQLEIGNEVSVKIIKINYNDNNMILIGKLV